VGESKSINVFLAKIFGFYFLWLISDNWLSHVWGIFNSIWTYIYHILLLILNGLSTNVLELMGYEIVSNYRSIAIVGSYGVVIGDQCIGFGLIYAFAALISAYPAHWKSKLWFIPAGAFIIIIANVTRIVAIVISSFNNGEFKGIEQHDFFNYLVYALIFILWVLWIRFVVPERMNKSLTSK